jgi:hypothetical protein
MKLIVIAFVAGLMVGSITGCGSSGDSPETVADSFWTALQNQELTLARSYATPETADMLNDANNDQDVQVTLGETTMKDGEAHIQTTMKADNEGQSMDIAMTTVLVQQEGSWRVDVNKTMMSIFGGAMGEMMEQMGEAMQEMGESMAEGMQESMESMGESMNMQETDNDR